MYAPQINFFSAETSEENLETCVFYEVSINNKTIRNWNLNVVLYMPKLGSSGFGSVDHIILLHIDGFCTVLDYFIFCVINLTKSNKRDQTRDIFVAMVIALWKYDIMTSFFMLPGNLQRPSSTFGKMQILQLRRLTAWLRRTNPADCFCWMVFRIMLPVVWAVLSLNGIVFVRTSLFSLCACFSVLQSKHLGSHPEASRLVIGPSGI